ncbi:RIMS-binding protein 2 [Nymphon striatum]|nr:RIMS-binding protein 2 [Nymphon striatum]
MNLLIKIDFKIDSFCASQAKKKDKIVKKRKYRLLSFNNLMKSENSVGEYEIEGEREKEKRKKKEKRVKDTNKPSSQAKTTGLWIDTLQDRKIVEKELSKKAEECIFVQKKLKERTDLCSDLENQLSKALDKNTQLVINNCDLQSQYHHIETLEKECQELNEKLAKTANNTSKSEATTSNSKLANNLETVVRNLREAGEKRKELEKEHAEALAHLRTRQEEAKKPRRPGERDRDKCGETIESLESKVRELQKKCEIQYNCHEELMLEMTALRRQQAKQSWSSSQQSSLTDGLTSPESNISTPPEAVSSKSMSNGDSGMVQSYNSGTQSDSNMFTGFSMITDGPDFTSSVYENRFKAFDDHAGNTGVGFTLKPSRSMNELDFTSLSLQAERNSNKRTHNTLNNRTRPNVKYPYVNPELDQLMAKLEQDNRVLAELDKTRASIAMSTTLSSHHLPNAISTAPFVPNHHPMGSSYRSTEQLLLDSNRNLTDHTTRNILRYTHLDGNNLILDESAEYIDIPGKGVVQVFVAKYTYDPLIHSPNENPEAELTVAAGEYIVVHGDMDEDGFYNGELLDGRNGLVPSNFVVKLIGEDLYDFQTQVIYGSTKDSDDSGASFSQELDFLDDNQLSLEDYKRMNDYIDLEDIEEVDEDNLSELEGSDILIPPPNAPQRLTLQKQLSKSILIAWLPPDGSSDGIESYQIYVDGILKGTVKSQENTRALLEGVDSTRPHRISVRSVANTGKQSKDASCTITIGKDSPLAPAYVKGTNITSTSAVISWLPSNSNFQHVICVNSVEVRTVKPGIFRHTITGLAPNTEYRVSVRSKAGKSTPSKSAFNDEKNQRKMERLTAYVDFKTLPKGLPDPPIDVQVDSGPQDSTLLITWLPVTISATGGTSNGCPVTGYSVFVDGKRMSEVESPTSDHTLLDISSLDQTNVKSITVRTKSGESLSGDSISCKVPSSVKGKKEKLPAENESSFDRSNPIFNHMLCKSMSRYEYKSNGFRFFGSIQGVEDFEDSSDRDELSDIAEEPEEELSDNLQGKSTEKKTNTTKEGTEKETKKSEKAHSNKETSHQKSTKETGTSPQQRSSKEGKSQKSSKDAHRHQENRSLQKTTQQSSGKKKHEVTERRDSADQIILETEDNLSDKEIMPSSHVAIPSIEITKDSASEGRNSIEPFSDEDYEHAAHGRSRTSTDKYASERHHKDSRERPSNPQSHGRHSQNAHPGQDRGYPDKRGSGPNTQPSRRPVPGYNNGYHRDSDYRHEDDYRKGQTYRKDKDYKRGSDGRRDHNQPYRDVPQQRQFVALFDYDPQTMSPNPDAADEELPFVEGQIITIYGDKDSDGFYRGESCERTGYVPCNMVSEVQLTDEELAHHLLKNGHMNRPRGRGRAEYHSEPWNPSNLRKMVALFDYDPRKSSPNIDAETIELTFNTGDIIFVHGPVDPDGFFMADISGQRGLVPSNYVTDVPADYRDGQRNELVTGKVSHQRRKDPIREGPSGRGPPPPTATNSGFYPSQQGSGHTQLPQDHHNNPRNYAGEKGPYPNERGHYPNERGQHQNDRGPYPSERSQYPSERSQYANERSQYPSERGQYQNERGQYGNERGQYAAGERSQYSADRGKYPSERSQYPPDRMQYPGERSQIPGERSQLPGERSQLPGERSQLPGERSQLPGERSQLPGERSQLPGERSQFPSDRSQLPGDRSQLPSDRSQLPGDRSQLPGDRSQFPGERSQLPGERSQLPGERSQLPGERSQLPSDRSQLPNDRSQFPSERSQYPSERGQHPNDRGQYAGDKVPANRSQYHGERSQIPLEQGQYPNERPGQYQGDKGAYSGPKSQYPNDRIPNQGDRKQYEGERGQYAGSDGYPPRAGSYPQMPHANNSPAPTAEQYSARNQNSQFNNAPSRMPYGQSQKVGAGGKW